jgi:hypothetical protein
MNGFCRDIDNMLLVSTSLGFFTGTTFTKSFDQEKGPSHTCVFYRGA